MVNNSKMKQSKSAKKSAQKKRANKEEHYPDFSKDPFFIKKDEMARRGVERSGFPEAFLKKK